MDSKLVEEDLRFTFRRFFFFGEVPDNVRALFVNFAENVEEEGIDVEVKRLVVEKELGHQAQVLG